MTKVAETKGYFNVRGKIFGLDNKEPYESAIKRSLSFRINTSKNNALFVNVGEWLNSTMTVKLKGEGMEEVVDVTEQEAIDEIKGLFKDGDSVFVGLRMNINTYKKKIEFLVNKIYILDKELDFEADDFEEVNELNTSAIIISEPSEGSQNVAFADYKGEMLPQSLTIEDSEIQEYFNENAEIGDVLRLTLKVVKRPIFEETEEDTKKEDKKEEVRTTLKGKKIGGNSNKPKRKIIGNEELLIVTDVDVMKTDKKKYSVEVLQLTNKEEEADMPF